MEFSGSTKLLYSAYNMDFSGPCEIIGKHELEQATAGWDC